MDEKEADQLWRELADTDRAAKRGFGVGFGNAATGPDPLERSNAPAGLSSTFRKATDVESKEMAQEKVSARDRIRARIKDALQDKKATQQREDSQWDNFLTQKKRERVGLEAIVDDKGRMLGCTYDYTDLDNADLDNAISRATAARTAGTSAAEEDHAAAIFGGGNSKGHGRERQSDTAAHRHRHSPSRNHKRDMRQMDRGTERHRDEGRSFRYRDNVESGRCHERRHPREEHVHRTSARGHRRHDAHRDTDEQGHRRDWNTGKDSSRRRDGDALHARDHGRSTTEGSPPLSRDRHRERERRQRNGAREGRAAREERGARERDSMVRDDVERDGKRGDGGRQRCEDGQRGLGVSDRGRRSTGMVDGRADSAPLANGLSAGGAGAALHGAVVQPQVKIAGGTVEQGGVSGHSGPMLSGKGPSGVTGDAVAAGLGLGVLEGVVPEGAVVVEESEIYRREPEVEAHDALDASVVVKARGSWREQLRQRMEGVL